MSPDETKARIKLLERQAERNMRWAVFFLIVWVVLEIIQMVGLRTL